MAKIFIKTFGCALNQSDSELMAGILKKEGHKIVGDERKADVAIINSCTVKDEAENKLYKEIRAHKDRKVIVAGCVAQADKDLVDSKLNAYSIIGTSQLTKIGIVVKETIEGKRVVLLERVRSPRLNLPKIRKNKIIEIIPISEGCLGSCTYCKTKHARGSLISYEPEEIKRQVISAVKDGAKEIWLTSQDTGAYGLDMDTDLPELLEALIRVEGDFKIRLGMCNPNFAVKYLRELSIILNHDKMFKFIHLPLQSGSDDILKVMNRQYSGKEFSNIVTKLKKEVNGLTIATDVIVGFPGEKDNDFDDTLKMIKRLKPDIVNISRYWKRPGTPAAKMKQLDSKLIKQRGMMLMDAFKKISLQNNKRWVGWKGDAIVSETGKNKTFIARNASYKPIILKGKKHKLGNKVKAKIRSGSVWDIKE